MEARKLLYSFMAVAPLGLMAGIGVHARTYVDSYEFPDAGMDHTRITAYLPLAIETSEKLDKRLEVEEGEAQRIAGLWIEGHRSGKLLPLIPVAADEFAPSGCKAKIIASNGQLARRLIDFADQRIYVEDYRDAAKNLVLASDSLAALKYSSFPCLFTASRLQSHVLNRIETIFPRVDEGTRGELVACMDRIKGNRVAFASIARRARVVIMEEISRHDDAHEALKTASQMVPEGSFFEQSAFAKKRPGVNMEALQLEQSLRIPSQTSEASQCLAVDERNRLTIHKIVSRVSKPAL